MTGYESKRAAAQDKLVDDRRAYYEKFDDLYAVYLNGVYDGKKAAQPAQEPVAWLCKADENGLFGLPTADKACKDCFPVYTAPQQRPWVGLTNDEVYKIAFALEGEHWRKIADAIEAKLKEKNNG
jgi:hypothetical protein